MDIVIGETIPDEGAATPFLLHLESVLTKKLLIQAMSGAGKSWLIRRILEQTFPHIQQIVLDSEGDFKTLREKFPYALIGGDQGDVPVSLAIARPLAHKLLELHTSAIIDISDLEVGRKENERCDFVAEFLSGLLRSPQRLWHPTLVVLDEAQEFAPERFSASSTEDVIHMAGQSRKRGFGVILATNRLSELSKSAAAHCKNKLIGGSMGIDAGKAAFELGFKPRQQDELQELSEGQFFAIGPAFPRGVSKVQIGEVETTHPSPSGRGLVSVPPPMKEVKGALTELASLHVPPEQEGKQAGKQEAAVACDHEEELTKLRGTCDEQLSKILHLEEQLAENAKLLEATEEERMRFLRLRKAFSEVFDLPVYQVKNGEVEQIGPVDTDAIVSEVLKRIPQNGQTVQVTPPEALRKKYLTVVCDRLYERISGLDPLARQVMEVVLSDDKFWPVTTISKTVTGQTGGTGFNNTKSAIKQLFDLGLVSRGGQGGGQYKQHVGKLVVQELSAHSPSDQEVDQVVQHVLSKVVTG